MNRDFEFKQLLRAYRAGIINEKTFESEMAEIEHGGSANGSNGIAGGFRYLGKTYKSERDAVVSFLDKSRAGEANGAEIFKNFCNPGFQRSANDVLSPIDFCAQLRNGFRFRFGKRAHTYLHSRANFYDPAHGAGVASRIALILVAHFGVRADMQNAQVLVFSCGR